MTAWTAGQMLLSTPIESGCQADAFSAGRAVARALGGRHGVSVETEPASA